MADNATRIVITADDRASGALGKIGDSVRRLGDSAGGLGALKASLGGLAGAFSAGALISFTKGMIDAADNLQDLSQKVGIGVKELAGWQLAAEQSGTSLEAVAKGVTKLSKAMVENGEALQKAGITAKDANGAMIQLADIFAALPEGVEKTNLAVALFGEKMGTQLIPLLNQGSKGLADAQAKAKRYADEMARLAPKADEFNDALKELEINGKAAAINSLQPLVDGLVGVAQMLNDAAAGGDRLNRSLAFLRDTGWVGSAIARYVELTRTLNAMLGIGQGEPKREASGRIGGIDEESEKKRAREMLARIDAERLRLALGGGDKPAKEPKEKRARTFDAEKAWGEASQWQAEDFAKTLAAQAREAENAAKAQESLLRKYRDMIDPLQKYRVELEEVARLEGISDGERLEMIWKINEAMDAEIGKLNGVGDAAKKTNDFARDMGLTFASAFEDAIIGGKNFSDVLKGLAQDIERIVLRKTITEPLGNAISEAISGSSGIGDFFGNLFGGARAAGGPVAPGQFYVVGENGPEILLPNTAGMVVPSGAAASAPAAVNIHFSVTAMDARSFRDSMAANKATVVGIVRDAFTRRAITSPV